MDFSRYDRVRAVQWRQDHLALLDQRALPFSQDFRLCHTAADVADAIRDLTVRGAPAIGIAAAWGMVLAARQIQAPDGRTALGLMADDMDRLRASRPTAVNLAWALDRLSASMRDLGADWRDALEAAARKIETEDLAANRAMGMLGAALIEPGAGVLTHCNTGSLATAGFGTALGVIRAGVAQQKIARVYAGETRPWLQGARLTVWELQQDGIAATLIADAAAGFLMRSGAVQWIVVGADRITANGDVANKIGTYALAIAARYHGLRFMVVAPSSTVDMHTADAAGIEIELRSGDELLSIAGHRTVAEGIDAWNPVFDVTPAELVDALVTERGVILAPNLAKMQEVFGAP